MSFEPRDRSAETRALAEGLSREVEPVRRIPRLRSVLGGVVALAGVAAGWTLLRSGGVRSDLVAILSQYPGFAAIGVGLVAMGVGGSIAAVAASVPGRDALERFGMALLVVGAFVGFLAAPGWILLHSAGVSLWPGRDEFMCLQGAIWVALLPCVAVLGFVFWAAPRRPVWAGLFGVAGAVALGAITMHASCPNDGAAHWIMGHALAPLMGALAAVLPLVLLSRWWTSRRALRS